MKYHNKITVIDNIKFSSMKESQRYLYLKNETKLGIISDLKLQVPFELQPSFKINNKTIRKVEYLADFTYKNNDTGEIVIEDVKPSRTFKTATYKLKAKMFAYKYKSEIKEVY